MKESNANEITRLADGNSGGATPDKMQAKLPVYKMVEGARVRVPGDVRDPNRRYAQTANVQTGETYLREFTDEEEREADARAAAWEAEKPQREAEARRREEEAAQFRESLRYEQRIVAFLDILGWAAAITASTTSIEVTQKLGIAMQGLATHVNMTAWQREHGGPGGWPGDPMMTHFSDSLLISFSADRYAKSHIEMTLSTVIQTLMVHGFVARGAVCYGPLIHREALAYGPALVAAYMLEKNEAMVPRIILDRSLADVWGPGEPVQDREGTLLGYRKFWRQDDDGWYFFDHFSNPFGLFRLNDEKPSSALTSYMKNWRELIVANISENRDRPRVLRKYVWLARYFNRVCAENPSAKIDSISLLGD